MSDIEQELADLIEQVDGAGPVVVDDQEEQQEDIKQEQESTHVSYDDWVASGKDPDDYKGKNAFESVGEMIQESNKSRQEITALKNQVQQLTESFGEYTLQQTQQIRAELEQKLAAAKEDEDIDKALTTQQQINNLPTDEPTKGEHPLIQTFRTDNPLLDKNSEQFNSEFDADVESFFNGQVKEMGGNLSDTQIKRVLESSMKKAKDLSPELFKSPKNKNKPLPRGQEPAVRRDNSSRLKSVKLEGKNANAASDVHDFLKEKYGDAFDGDSFTDNVAGEQ